MDSLRQPLPSARGHRWHCGSYLPASSRVCCRGQHPRHILSRRECALCLPAGARATGHFAGCARPQISWFDSVFQARGFTDLPDFAGWSVVGAFPPQPRLASTATLPLPLHAAFYSRGDTPDHHSVSQHLDCVSERHMNFTNAPNHALQRTRRERRGCNPRVLWAGSLSLGRYHRQTVTLQPREPHSQRGESRSFEL